MVESAVDGEKMGPCLKKGAEGVGLGAHLRTRCRPSVIAKTLYEAERFRKG